MSWKAACCVGVISWLAPLTGCLMGQASLHTLKSERQLYNDDLQIRDRLETEAESVWHEIAKSHPPGSFSDEFVDGFLEGFVDYLDSGGSATPPPVPPSKYRTAKYLSPEGHARLKDYYAGFKYGSEVACASGQREFYTFPILVPESTAPLPIRLDRLPKLTDDLPEIDGTKKPLPAPRPVEPNEAKPEEPPTDDQGQP